MFLCFALSDTTSLQTSELQPTQGRFSVAAVKYGPQIILTNKSASRCVALSGELTAFKLKTDSANENVWCRMAEQQLNKLLPFIWCWEQHHMVTAAISRINVTEQTPADISPLMKAVMSPQWCHKNEASGNRRLPSPSFLMWCRQTVSSCFFMPTALF